MLAPYLSLRDLTVRAASAWPERCAIVASDGSLSYRELHRASRRLAEILLAQGVRPGDRVVVLGVKERHTVAAMFAAWMVGAICVPMDPELPIGRREFVRGEAEPRVIMGPARLRLQNEGSSYVATDACVRPHARFRTRFPRVVAEAPAYLMYTSGSTGLPKGVLIEHGSIEQFFAAHAAGAAIRPGDRCLNTGPFHFDVCILDVFLPLACGATVVLTAELPIPALMLSSIERHRITHLYAVGSVLALLTGDKTSLDRYDLSSLRVLQTGAEVCNPSVVNEWLRRVPGLSFLNSYGPTEATVGCSFFKRETAGLLPLGCDVPIGRPHPGSCILLVDAADRPITQAREVGHALIGGRQLMRGYWKRPDEERTRIVVLDGQRFYRTGDLMFQDEHGLLHYAGRADEELKIDGVRIHPNEVKRCLEQLPSVQGALAGPLELPNGKLALGAAVAVQGEATGTLARTLARHLGRELPPAFMPRALLLCKELPLTSTGKADRRGCLSMLSEALGRSAGRFYALADGSVTPIHSLQRHNTEGVSPDALRITP